MVQLRRSLSMSMRSTAAGTSSTSPPARATSRRYIACTYAIISSFVSLTCGPWTRMSVRHHVANEQTPLNFGAGEQFFQIITIDCFKDTKLMDNVGRQKGCVAQVAAEKGMFTFVANIQIPGSTHYSLVMYFITSSLKKGSLLQRFFNGDDEFCNSRLKLAPSVLKGSWIVRQSVGSTPCLLGKAVDCSYVRGPGYLEVDADIGSSVVANGVLGLVFGVVTTLVVDMAFLIQANTYDELPEQVIGAARLAHVEPSAAVVPDLDNNSDNSSKDNSNNNNTSSEDVLSKKTN